MGIFDIFKKKKTDYSFPENELEKTLILAQSEFSAQKDFYRKLLWNQLYVLSAEHSISEVGNQVLEKDTIVKFVTFDNGQIPVFTSTNRIFDKGFIKEEVPYLAMSGQDLFGIAIGATFILNPYSDYNKELIPEEIESLLNGTIYDKIDEQEIQNIKYQKFDEIYNRAGKRQEGLILLDGYNRKKLSSSEKTKLEESIKDYQKCLEIIPEHWQSMMLMAKAYQRLEMHFDALKQLEIAFKIELDNYSIPLEASLEAMHLNDIDKALFYSLESIKRKPNDFVLLGNYAMNLLIAKKDKVALQTIQDANKINPNDPINKNIESIIKNVISGKQKRPTFEDTIK